LREIASPGRPFPDNAPMTKPELTVTVAVRPLPEQSQPEAGVHAFAYTVTIRNSGDVNAQLIGRHWIIEDANGKIEQVRGLGVVGHQPLLKPGEEFEYTSWTRLATATGSMKGTYFCVTDEARPFEAPIAEFALVAASALH
jgi:ApaG protein